MTKPRIPSWCPAGFQGRYTVVRGDTMFFIAKRFGVSLQALINANRHISDPNLIYPGDVLCVPDVANGRVPKRCPKGFQCRYTVQKGDTMFLIAQRFGVSLQALINANPHIADPNQIFPGDVLCVPCVGVKLPCCLILKKTVNKHIDTSSVALIRALNTGVIVIDVMAVSLPEPECDFDSYIVKVNIPGTGTFSSGLIKTDILDTWVTSIPLPEGTTLTTDTSISIKPFNEESGSSGSVILSNTLAFCQCSC